MKVKDTIVFQLGRKSHCQCVSSSFNLEPARTFDSISLVVLPFFPLHMHTSRMMMKMKTPTKGTKRLYSPICRTKCSVLLPMLAMMVQHLVREVTREESGLMSTCC